VIAKWFCDMHPRQMLVFVKRDSVRQLNLQICQAAYCPQCWRMQQAQILAAGYARAKAAPRMVVRK
jgi:hypothetical protein